MNPIDQFRKGSTPLLLLTVLAEGRQYGYQIMRALEKRSGGYFSMTAALLYPALHQLEQDGLVESEWEDGQGLRRRKYYSITSKGQAALAETRISWEEFITHLQETLQSPGQNLSEV
jgi:PadR family transcriptional regulator, regulatory protein PadR